MTESNYVSTTNELIREQEQQVELLSQRVAELQRLNEEKVRTIAEKDDRIVGLVNEVEAMKRQAGELVDQRERMAREAEGLRGEIDRQRDDAASDVKIARNEIRDGILQFADEHDCDREWINGLLEGYLDMEPAPELVEATVVIEATVLFRAGSGTPSDLSAFFVETNVDFDMEARPRYSSGLEFEEVREVYVDVREVETN